MTEKEKAVKSLRILRNRLTDDEDLKIPIHDEKFLIRFVRGKKYDAEAAHETVRKYYTLRKKNPKVFRIAYPSYDLVKELLENNAVMKLKHDSEGRAVVAWNFSKWDVERYNFDHMAAAYVLVIEELLLFSVETQINGIVFIGNCDDINLTHVKYMSPGRMKSILQIAQGSFPLKIKKFCVVNNPSLFEMVYALMKTFMTAKFRERFEMFGKDLEKFHSILPVDKLPMEYGGKLTEDEAYDQTFKEGLLKRDTYYKELLEYGFGEWDSEEEDTYM